MITITRRVARQLQAVFRPNLLGLDPCGPPPLLTFRVGRGHGLRVRFASESLALECALPGPPRPREAAVMPMELLERIQARDDSPVTLEVLGDQTLACWAGDELDPQWARVAVPRLASMPPFPRLPASLFPAPHGLLDVLAEASAEVPGGFLRLGGKFIRPDLQHGQALGLPLDAELPWRGEVLVASTPAYRAVAGQPSPNVLLARTPTRLVIVRGAWSMWLRATPTVRTERANRETSKQSRQSRRRPQDRCPRKPSR